MLAACLIVFGSLLFVCYTNTVDSARVIVGLSGAASLVLILSCGLRDPGLCPKELPPPIDAPPHDPLEVQVRYTNFDGTTGTATVVRKWCYSCNLYRPVRAVHCRFCDVCVCRRDHHCPWTGICIGARNYLAYFLLVWCTLVLVLTAFVGGIVSLSSRIAAIDARQEAATVPESERVNAFAAAITETYCLEIVLIAVSALWAMLVGTLAPYHLYLALNNKTSGDDAKHERSSGNCYNRGSFLRNVKDAFSSPALLMYEGSPLPSHVGEWAVTVEAEEEDDGPQVVPNLRAMTDRCRRREGEDVLMRSLSASACEHDEEEEEGDSPPNAGGGARTVLVE